MKVLILTSLALSVAVNVSADKEISFPFTGEPSVRFLRVGDNQYPEPGAIVRLKRVGSQWELSMEFVETNQDTRNEKLKEVRKEKLTEDEALELLSAFSALYDHWHNAPSTDELNKRYSIVVYRDSFNWTTEISVKDSGSEELDELLDLLEYRD
ncbi:MAG: hypothetical protein ACFB21_11000 [Opitutales bacterium]